MFNYHEIWGDHVTLPNYETSYENMRLLDDKLDIVGLRFKTNVNTKTEKRKKKTVDYELWRSKR